MTGAEDGLPGNLSSCLPNIDGFRLLAGVQNQPATGGQQPERNLN